MAMESIMQIFVKNHRVLSPILFFLLFQKFAFFGFQAGLFLFLKHELRFDLHNAIGSYHAFVGMCYVLPVIGTMITDLYVSKLSTILMLTWFSFIGNTLTVMASVGLSTAGRTEVPFVTNHLSWFVIIGLAANAIGQGTLLELARRFSEEEAIGKYFEEENDEGRSTINSLHRLLTYFVTAGKLFAFVVLPILRMQVECFGDVYCYPLTFLIPAICGLLATIILMGGWTSFRNNPPEGTSIHVDFVNCIKKALGNLTGGGLHWIDNAAHEYDNDFLDEMKATLHALLLYWPLPMFWALFEQMGSRWVFQATNMIWKVSDKGNFYIEPDQMQSINPATAIIIILMTKYVFLRYFEKFQLSIFKPKSKMIIGSLLMVLAFTTASFVEYQNEKTHAFVPKAGEGDLLLFNTLVSYETKWTTSIQNHEQLTVNFFDIAHLRNLPVVGTTPIQFNVSMVTSDPICKQWESMSQAPDKYKLVEGKVVVIVLSPLMPLCDVHELPADDTMFPTLQKSELQLPKLGVVYYTRRVNKDGLYIDYDFNYPDSFLYNITDAKNPRRKRPITLDPNHNGIDFFLMRPAQYFVTNTSQIPNTRREIRMDRGGVYALIIVFYQNEAALFTNHTVLTQPNTMQMKWQIPQYVLMSVAQFLLPYTVLEYSLTQVSKRMKPILYTVWILTIAFGNFIVAITSFINMFTRELYYYIFFSSIMAASLFLQCGLFCNMRKRNEDIQA